MDSFYPTDIHPPGIRFNVSTGDPLQGLLGIAENNVP